MTYCERNSDLKRPSNDAIPAIISKLGCGGRRRIGLARLLDYGRPGCSTGAGKARQRPTLYLDVPGDAGGRFPDPGR